MRLGKIRVQSIERKSVGGFLPTESMKDEIFSEIEDTLEPMIKEGDASPPDITSAYTREVIAQWYVGRAPRGVNLATNTVCHGSRLQVTSYRVYTVECRPARSPEEFRRIYGHYPRVWMIERGKKVHVAYMAGNRREGTGRMGGDRGWDKTRDLFGFVLASFKHNFQAVLGAFADRPSLPCDQEWHLPNLVHARKVVEIEKRYGCKIVEPPVAVPPASYKFNFTIPTPMIVLAVGTNCPRDTKCIIEVWDSKKADLCDPLSVEFPKGESETIFVIEAPLGSMLKSGYFNINPINSEMTVAYVNVVFPPI